MATRSQQRAQDQPDQDNQSPQSEDERRERSQSDQLRELAEADQKALKDYDGPDFQLDTQPVEDRLEAEKLSPLNAAKADQAQVAVGVGDDAPVIGSYVTIDRDDADVKKVYENLPPAAGNYGVFHTLREDVAMVQLRDATHQFIGVPVTALRAAQGRAR